MRRPRVAVQLPKQFPVKSKDISRQRDKIVQREKPGTMVRAFDSLAGFKEHSSLPKREKDCPQKRKGL
jgi:hypothetical protein